MNASWICFWKNLHNARAALTSSTATTELQAGNAAKEGLFCACKRMGRTATHLRPEFTMAAGMDRPKNAIRPLMKPGKFCSAHVDHQHSHLEYTHCYASPSPKS